MQDVTKPVSLSVSAKHFEVKAVHFRSRCSYSILQLFRVIRIV